VTPLIRVVFPTNFPSVALTTVAFTGRLGVHDNIRTAISTKVCVGEFNVIL
jgi:hypothetical protein